MKVFGVLLATALVSFPLNVENYESEIIREKEREKQHQRTLKNLQRQEELKRMRHNLYMQELSYDLERARASEIKIKNMKGIVGNTIILGEGALVSGEMTPLGKVDVSRMKIGKFSLNPWFDLPTVQYQGGVGGLPSPPGMMPGMGGGLPPSPPPPPPLPSPSTSSSPSPSPRQEMTPPPGPPQPQPPSQLQPPPASPPTGQMPSPPPATGTNPVPGGGGR